MSLTFPRADIMSMVGYAPATKPLQLLERQELSRQAGGITLAKDFGPALWLGDFTTVALSHAAAVAFEAALHSLDGAIRLFEAGDLRNGSMPLYYPTGVFSDTGVIHSLDSATSMSLASLPASFHLSAGDFLSFDYGSPSSRALHQVMESVVANGSGQTAVFEVRPQIRAGAVTSTAVKLKTPRGLFTLVPGSVAATPAGGKATSISFQAGQYL